MIIGHIATGLLVQALSAGRLGPKAIPIWTTVFGSTLNDILTGLFVLLGLETVKANPKFSPLGLEFTHIDWSHSWSMILIWSLIWASFTTFINHKTKATDSNSLWYYSMLSVLVHTIADYAVHNPDMALFPNSKIKLGAKLWSYAPISSWCGELLLTLLGVGLMYYYYGGKMKLPGILLISMHLMNYPGSPTNIPYMLGNTLSGNLLRYAVGMAFIVTYFIPNLLLTRCIDGPLTVHKTQ